jgi:hypothetical protein
MIVALQRRSKTIRRRNDDKKKDDDRGRHTEITILVKTGYAADQACVTVRDEHCKRIDKHDKQVFVKEVDIPEGSRSFISSVTTAMASDTPTTRVPSRRTGSRSS